jgi:predicted TIM-barrel fold metal-dependent hydrolase
MNTGVGAVSGGAPLVVCDPHVHIWDLATGLYPARARRRDASEPGIGDYHIADLRADCGPVVLASAVHVEAFPTDGLAEVRHVLALAEAADIGLPQGIVANADLARSDADAALAALAALPRVRGIRQALNRADETRDLLCDPRWRDGFTLLARHGLSFDLQIAPERMREAAALLTRHPEIPVALNHAGWPKARGLAAWRVWREGLRALAALPHVHVKISGFGMFERDWTLESIRPYVFEAIDAFGTDRAMFASNFPVDRLARDYPSLWRAFAALVEDLDEASRGRLLRANAEAFYRL